MRPKPKIIAEIGCNHKGDLGIAREMIKVAAQFCRADVVKFQKRNPRELLTEEEYNKPHPDPQHAYGKTYGKHREYLEFDLDQHRELKIECESCGIEYTTSVWDVTSARDIMSLGPGSIKIPSACNLKYDLLDVVAREFPGEIHISVGMTTFEEEKRIVDFLERQNRLGSLVIYSCTSGYPVDFNEICLLEITRLKENYGDDIKAIGFSGHHLGIAMDVAAYTLGADYIERHFTLDRTWKGTDHAASLEPDGLRRVVRDVQRTREALTAKPCDILDVEQAQRTKLKRL